MIDSELNRTSKVTMESEIKEFAKKIISKQLTNIRRVSSSNNGNKVAVVSFIQKFDTEEEYKDFLSKRIVTLIQMTLFLAKLLPEWHRIDIVITERIFIGPIEPGIPLEVKFDIKLFSR